MKKVYVITADKVMFVQRNGKHTEKRAPTRGRLTVSVDEAVIKLRGERVAVLSAAWRKLMGENDLGEVVAKKLVTRRELRTEINSRYGGADEVFRMFVERAEYRWIANEF